MSRHLNLSRLVLVNGDAASLPELAPIDLVLASHVL
jgi:hypothetical protein